MDTKHKIATISFPYNADKYLFNSNKTKASHISGFLCLAISRRQREQALGRNICIGKILGRNLVLEP